ncbi:carbohydrate ABC transporter permease [Acididesulfobacillus acetoxydans]|nr:carbohydrate ABC transporter permease [Acididesulfobacillus acetoxydans]
MIPKHPTLVNYINAFANSPLPRFFSNSIIVSGGALVLSLAFGSIAAYVFARKAFPLRRVLFYTIIAVRMIPALLSIIPLYVIMYKINLLNTYTALIIAYMATGIPVVTWIMKGFFESIPMELEEAAMLDGCSQLQIFYKIILPPAVPGLGASAIFVFVRIWNEYIIALSLTSTTVMRTLPVGIKNALGSRMADYGSMAAYSVVAIIPIVILFLCFQRYFVSGLTNGSVK